MRFKFLIFSPHTVFIVSIIVVVFSVVPVAVPGQVVLPFFDKIIHCLVYIFLAFITLNTLRLKKVSRAHAYSFLYAFFLGCIIEIVQFFLPHRDFETADLVSNFLGSLLGCLIKIV